MILVTLFAVLYELTDILDEEQKFNYMGNTIIFFLSISLLINIAFSIYSVILTILSLFNKEKAQEPLTEKPIDKKSLVKVHPKPNNS